MKKIEELNNMIPWLCKEGDSNGCSIDNPIIALGNLQYAMKCINEFDGSLSDYKKSGYMDVGDLSILFASAALHSTGLSRLLTFDPFFALDTTQTHTLHGRPHEREELYKLEGLERVLGMKTLYHQIVKITKKSEFFYAGRVIRLNEPDWAKLFW